MLAAKINAALELYRDTRAILPFDDRGADKYAEVLFAREPTGLPSTPQTPKSP